MFENLPVQPQDKILKIMQAYREDARQEKIDLGVGVYKNAAGETPVMRAVKTAEQQLWQRETSKSYVGLVGAPDFSDAMIDLILGDAVDRDSVAAAATPGGTGALRQAFELIKTVAPDASVWVSNPTWGNHVSILNHLGVANKKYRYFDFATGTLDAAGMMKDLEQAKEGDIILLHGACHNPSGLDLTLDQWQSIVDLLLRKNLVPMIDLAYQGFGKGLDQDAAGTRLVAESCPELLIAASCSKNFGVYRERTGIFMGVSKDKSKTAILQGNMAHLNRQNFSFPPDHGARLVTMVLTDPALRSDWQTELEDMRKGVEALREQLAAELRRSTNSNRFDFVVDHRGMFSMLGLTKDQVAALASDHAVYAVGDSRINMAGLNKNSVPVLAKAVAAVI